MSEGALRNVPSFFEESMFKRLLLISALLIALCAGFFSISGIGQLFIGAPIAAMIMAASLELGKLVTVSFVYRYWNICSRALRGYFLTASAILMLITSTGVYGYLSAAYAKAAVGVQAVQNDVALIETRQKSIDASVGRLEARAHSLESVRIQQENRLDRLVGRRGLADQQRIIRQADQQQTEITNQIAAFTRTRDSLESRKVEVQNNLSTNSKIGTFWYIAKSLGVELDSIVRWFILAIVLVLDPLSITLIIAYNMITKHEETPDPATLLPPLSLDDPPIEYDDPPPALTEPEAEVLMQQPPSFRHQSNGGIDVS
jgi:hypothetical protein